MELWGWEGVCFHWGLHCGFSLLRGKLHSRYFGDVSECGVYESLGFLLFPRSCGGDFLAGGNRGPFLVSDSLYVLFS